MNCVHLPGARREATTIRTTTCTVQLEDGAFCDRSSAPDVPFPICTAHADELFWHLAATTAPRQRDIAAADERMAVLLERMRPSLPADIAAHRAERAAQLTAQSVVYYLRVAPGVVKIGYTTNVHQRLSALRCTRSDLLATEPGGRDAERDRHRQFAHLRCGRNEDFYLEVEIVELIDQLRQQFGPPAVTSYVG